VKVSEGIDIVYPALIFETVKAAPPDVLVPVFEVLKFDHDVVQSFLVKVNLLIP